MDEDLIFSGFSLEQKNALLAQAKFSRFLPAQHVFHQTEFLDELYILLDGSLQIGWLKSDGEFVVHDLIKSNTAFNLVALLQKKPLNYDYFAVGRVELASISQDHFFSLLYTQPEAMQQVILLLSQRMYAWFEQNRYLRTATLNQRMAKYLLKLANLYGEHQHHEIILKIKLSQQDFSELFNVSRQTLNKHIQYLVNEKVIHWGYGEIKILDLKRLQKMSELE